MTGPGFDYFAGSARPASPFGAGGPSAPSFGTPPGPPPPLAAPAFGGPAPFGAPAAPQPAPTPATGRRPTATVLVLAALLVAVVGGGAWWWTHRGDGLPDHLGPYARSTDPAITSAMDLARDQARRQAGAVGDYSIDAAAYGTSAQGAFLFRLTGPGVAGAFGDQLAGLPGIQRVGADRCVAMGPASMCVRVEGDRALMVVTADGTHGSAGVSGGVGAVLTASWTDQAWAAMQ